MGLRTQEGKSSAQLTMTDTADKERAIARWVQQVLFEKKLSTRTPHGEQRTLWELSNPEYCPLPPNIRVMSPSALISVFEAKGRNKLLQQGHDSLIVAGTCLLLSLAESQDALKEVTNSVKTSLKEDATLGASSPSLALLSLFSLTIAMVALADRGVEGKALVNFARMIKASGGKHLHALMEIQFLAHLPASSDCAVDVNYFGELHNHLARWLISYAGKPDRNLPAAACMNPAYQKWAIVLALSKMTMLHVQYAMDMCHRAKLWSIATDLLIHHRDMNNAILAILLHAFKMCPPRPPARIPANLPQSQLAALPGLRDAIERSNNAIIPASDMTLPDWQSVIRTSFAPGADICRALNNLAQAAWTGSVQETTMEPTRPEHGLATAEALGIAYALLREVAPTTMDIPRLLTSFRYSQDFNPTVHLLLYFVPIYYGAYFSYSAKPGMDGGRSWELLGVYMSLCFDINDQNHIQGSLRQLKDLVHGRFWSLFSQALPVLQQAAENPDDLRRATDLSYLPHELNLIDTYEQNPREMVGRLAIFTDLCLGIRHRAEEGDFRTRSTLRTKLQPHLSRVFKSLNYFLTKLPAAAPRLNTEFIYTSAGVLLRLLGPTMPDVRVNEMMAGLYGGFFIPGVSWSTKAHLVAAPSLADVIRCCAQSNYSNVSMARALRHLIVGVLFGGDALPDGEIRTMLYRSMSHGLWCCACTPKTSANAESRDSEACRLTAILKPESERVKLVESRMRCRLDTFRAQFWFDLGLEGALCGSAPSQVQRRLRKFLYIALTERCSCDRRAPPADINHDLFPLVRPLILALWRSMTTSPSSRAFGNTLTTIVAALQCPAQLTEGGGNTMSIPPTLLQWCSHPNPPNLSPLGQALKAVMRNWVDLVVMILSLQLELITGLYTTSVGAESVRQILSTIEVWSQEFQSTFDHALAVRAKGTTAIFRYSLGNNPCYEWREETPIVIPTQGVLDRILTSERSEKPSESELIGFRHFALIVQRADNGGEDTVRDLRRRSALADHILPNISDLITQLNRNDS